MAVQWFIHSCLLYLPRLHLSNSLFSWSLKPLSPQKIASQVYSFYPLPFFRTLRILSDATKMSTSPPPHSPYLEKCGPSTAAAAAAAAAAKDIPQGSSNTDSTGATCPRPHLQPGSRIGSFPSVLALIGCSGSAPAGDGA